jgi:hypothetical protein
LVPAFKEKEHPTKAYASLLERLIVWSRCLTLSVHESLTVTAKRVLGWVFGLFFLLFRPFGVLRVWHTAYNPTRIPSQPDYGANGGPAYIFAFLTPALHDRKHDCSTLFLGWVGLRRTKVLCRAAVRRNRCLRRGWVWCQVVGCPAVMSSNIITRCHDLTNIWASFFALL